MDFLCVVNVYFLLILLSCMFRYQLVFLLCFLWCVREGGRGILGR